jgi:hypothetical protein
MVQITPNQDFSTASGILNSPFMEAVYHSFMSEAFVDLGRSVTFHLPPIKEQDVQTQSQAAPQQYNPFFSRVPVPATNTRNTGYKVTPRDVTYKAQIVIGPLSNDKRLQGMGWLNENEAMITVVIEALEHVVAALAVSIEGRRYTVVETRPIGFSVRRYLMVKLRAIQETENPSPDKVVG